MKEMSSVALIDDPLSYGSIEPRDAILRAIRLASVLLTRVNLHGRWGSKLPHDSGSILMYIVHSGHAIVSGRGLADPVRLESGDVLLVPWPTPHSMMDSLSAPVQMLREQIPTWIGAAGTADELLSQIFGEGGGSIGDTREPLSATITTLRMFNDGGVSDAYLRGLPPFIVLRGLLAAQEGVIEQTVDLIAETGKKGLRGQPVATRLAEALLTASLQAFFDQSTSELPELSAGLRDPALIKALELIYRRPGEHWTIEKLSREVGLSRTGFLKRFRATIGATPQDVLLSIRMRRSRQLLEQSKAPIARIAEEVGYSSEAAFNRAFRRWSGLTPGVVRRRSA